MSEIRSDSKAKCAAGVTPPAAESEQIYDIRSNTLPGAPDGEYVVIRYRTEFENKMKAVETVTPMLEADGAWRVSGYYIR